MGAATITSDTFGHGLAQPKKITKTRNRTVVKPILKKLHSTGSEKNSLDLDRGWDEQTLQYFDAAAAIPTPRTARDVSFSMSAGELGPSLSTSDPMSRRRRAGTPEIISSHGRSTSGASHASVATSNSGRNGSFVHPFQQTPRTSTPPLSQIYGSSNVMPRASLDSYGLGLREYEYNSTIVEDHDDTDETPYTSVTATPSTLTPLGNTLTTSSSTRREPGYQFGSVNDVSSISGRPPNHRHNRSISNGGSRPSLASQRTSSLSDVTSHQSAPRIPSSNRSNSGSTQRMGEFVNHGRPGLYAVSDSSGVDSSPPSSTVPTLYKDGNVSSSPLTLSTAYSSSLTNGTPILSPLRSSLDMSGFRLRSRSSLDTGTTHREQVRQARRKFEEKEKAKEEKYAREESKKRERADTKQAERQLRKGHSGMGSGRTSTSTDIRPAPSRKSTATARTTFDEKDGDLLARSYSNVPVGETPHARADDVMFAPAPRRTMTAKRKTTGAWTQFVLWLRTRLLKLGRR